MWIFFYFYLALFLPFSQACSSFFSRIFENQDLYSRYPSLIKINVSEYPLIRRDENVVENIHGNKILDPYRYLENLQNNETTNFIIELNKLSKKYLERPRYKNVIKDKIVEYSNFEHYGAFAKYGDYYYYRHNSGNQDNDSFYRKKNLNDRGKLFLDASKIANNNFTTLNYKGFSSDGSIMIYEESINNSDSKTIKFKNVNGKELSDVLTNVVISNLAFIFNNKGFIYSSFPDNNKNDGKNTMSKNEYHSLYYHKMGTSQKEDIIIVDFPYDKNMYTLGYTSDDGKILFVNFNKGPNLGNMVYYYNLSTIDENDLTEKLSLKPLFEIADANYEIIDYYGNNIIVLTDKNAPIKKVVSVNFEDAYKGETAWKTLIKEVKNRNILTITLIGQEFILLNCLEDVKSSLYVYNKMTGELIKKINIEPGIIKEIYGNKKSNEFFISLTSPISPSIVYRGFINVTTIPITIELKKIPETIPKIIDVNEFVVNQIFYNSKDKKNVSMFLFHKKNIKLDGNNPVLLEGYGGFGYLKTPIFSPSKIMFVKHFNGISCIANVRGGGEYGKEWHFDGMLHKKQNSFDDFISAAEYLISNNYTNPSKLAIRGVSNGGLLAAVVLQQRPDLLGSVIIKSGILDMLRFHKFTSNNEWTAEYGDPEIKEDFNYLMKYSPLHNLKLPSNSSQWPSIFLHIGKKDEKVTPVHTLKYIAQLYYVLQQANRYQTNPILADIEETTEHNKTNLINKDMDITAKEYLFLQQTLNLRWRNEN
ncbi:Prolyl endopeptidase [Strongyloides ratti]|uniref:Prolyl endopeptidase n=1 Tax=Strongyloides ratti TaxID=34506 RepID=A0A090LP95_STRRB|nr:Prolyl endopeptidase [Strongyloides ratti]CEF69340.1 Prolyl endopeptidase [Strongyloides ratti]